jgi:hypothetical protein
MATKKARAVRKSFTAVLEPDGTALKWTIARIPFDVAKVWPGRKGRRVRGEIEGFPFRTTLVSYPSGKGAVLIVNRQMRAAVHVGQGDKARIWLEPDFEEREILLPEELEKELKSDRGLWNWADEPKSPNSRKKRAEKMAERLMQAMEGEQEPPPVLKAAFQRRPRAREAWFALTPAQRRNHLLGIFYYETADGRERRAAKAVEEALGKAGSEGARRQGVGSSQ